MSIVMSRLDLLLMSDIVMDDHKDSRFLVSKRI